ncbi:hypothetical protein FOL47_007121 [Perkinsus chesapeaki]|uniref:sn-1-specific diacylglycerol lipase n=1 Tax=Perkinsus chesapeaki TaxID=330153 RepID=A0A7J6MXC4_PERCH|nr:hypothetical protein FOL47_007121 [Perkinsus chesapeaki]
MSKSPKASRSSKDDVAGSSAQAGLGPAPSVKTRLKFSDLISAPPGSFIRVTDMDVPVKRSRYVPCASTSTVLIEDAPPRVKVEIFAPVMEGTLAIPPTSSGVAKVTMRSGADAEDMDVEYENSFEESLGGKSTIGGHRVVAATASYIQEHRLQHGIESMMTELLVCMPEEPWKFVEAWAARHWRHCHTRGKEKAIEKPSSTDSMFKRLTGRGGYSTGLDASAMETSEPLTLPLANVGTSVGSSAFGPPDATMLDEAPGRASSPIIQLDDEDDAEEMAHEPESGIESGPSPQRRSWVSSLANALSFRRSNTTPGPSDGTSQQASPNHDRNTEEANQRPRPPPCCWKCTIDFTFTNRPRQCPMCGHPFCKACLAEAAGEVALTPAALQESVIRANRISVEAAERPTLGDLQRRQEQESMGGKEERDEACDGDDDAELGLDAADSGTRDEVRKGLNKLSGMLCYACLSEASKDMLLDRVKVRQERIQLYLGGRLPAYKSAPETSVAMVYRLGGNFLQALRAASSVLPMGAFAKYISGAYYLFRYGPLCIYGSEIVEAIGMLSKLTSSAGLGSRWTANTADVAAAIYYLMGEDYGARGNDPMLEAKTHEGLPVPSKASLSEVELLCSLAVHIPAESTPVDAQRLLRLQGWTLVLAEPHYSRYREFGHTFYLACRGGDGYSNSNTHKRAVLILPGTTTIGDSVTDLNAFQGTLHLADGTMGHCHMGMLVAAQHLVREVGSCLARLHSEGYRISLTGHSLGAGIASLACLILRQDVMTNCDTLTCVGFGSPACMDETLASAAERLGVISVVNRDDMVPRASVHNARKLIERLADPTSVARTRQYLAEDAAALRDIKRLTQLKRRRDHAHTDDGDAIMVTAEASGSIPSDHRHPEAEYPDLSPQSNGSRAWSDTLGSFFSGVTAAVGRPWRWAAERAEAQVLDDAVEGLSSIHDVPPDISQVEPLHHASELRVPGKVIHIYRRDGCNRCSYVPRDWCGLQQVQLQPGMLHDHFGRSYYMAIKQLAALVATDPKHRGRTPLWTPQSASACCSCCGSDFLWNSVLKSEAHRLLSRHNCYSCGNAVCDGCSKNRMNMLMSPETARCCDRCWLRPSHPS